MSLLALFIDYPVFFIFSVGLTGLLVGSFLNVVVHRLPIMLEREWSNEANEKAVLNLNKPRSHCPSCGHTLTAWENIPLVSYFFLKGKCSHCHASISLRYPLVELLTAILSAVVAAKFGVTIETATGLIFTWSLITLALIDFDCFILPDAITLPLVWLGIFFSFWAQVGLVSSVVGAMAGYLTLWVVFWAFKLITGKEGMGYGDFKLLAAIGAFLGWQMLPLTILGSSFVGAIIGLALLFKRGESIPIPFGPYLAIAGWIALIWGYQINTWYLQF